MFAPPPSSPSYLTPPSSPPHQTDAVDLLEVLQLLNQLVARFKEALLPLLCQLLPLLVLRVHELLTREWDWSGRLAAPSGAGGVAGVCVWGGGAACVCVRVCVCV